MGELTRWPSGLVPAEVTGCLAVDLHPACVGHTVSALFPHRALALSVFVLARTCYAELEVIKQG